jgi:hypothetical protein
MPLSGERMSVQVSRPYPRTLRTASSSQVIRSIDLDVAVALDLSGSQPNTYDQRVIHHSWIHASSILNRREQRHVYNFNSP